MLPRISLVEGEKAKFLLFSTNDLISNKIFTQGLWDDHLLTVSKMFYDAVESPLILDIGANLGAFSIPIAKEIKNVNGKVIAFEPQRVIFYQLCANVFINRLDNVFPVNSAVSDHQGSVDIPEFDYKENDNIGAFSLDKNIRALLGTESSASNKFFKVNVINLDAYEVDRAPALIKIDVEGYEINVLRGSLDFLKRYNYPPILFEAWHYEWFADEKKDLLSLFESIGYNLYSIDITNFVAQHPNNNVEIDFKFINGVIHMARIR